MVYTIASEGLRTERWKNKFQIWVERLPSFRGQYKGWKGTESSRPPMKYREKYQKLVISNFKISTKVAWEWKGKREVGADIGAASDIFKSS